MTGGILTIVLINLWYIGVIGGSWIWLGIAIDVLPFLVIMVAGACEKGPEVYHGEKEK